jgi:hypothetical protein
MPKLFGKPRIRTVARFRPTPGIRTALLKGLQPLKTEQCPFHDLPNSRKGQWGRGHNQGRDGELYLVRTPRCCGVKFTEWTVAVVLRHPEFVIRCHIRVDEIKRSQ